MKRTWRRRAKLTALVLIATAALGAVIVWWRYPLLPRYIFETRRFLFALKADGHAPDVSWFSVARRMGPRWMQSSRPTFVREGGTGADPCPVLWRTPLGNFWGGAGDGRVLEHLVMEELGGRIYDRAPAGIRAGDLVIDVGAHLGTFTAYALRRGAARVVAVEPMPAVSACFERTFAREIAEGRVVLEKVAAWNESTALSFEVGSDSTQSHVTDASGTMRVTATTIDTIVTRQRLPRVDFIKMDIEGAEPQAVAGAARTIAAHRPRMAICIYHAPTDPETVPAAVLAANRDYRVFTHSVFQAYFY